MEESQSTSGSADDGRKRLVNAFPVDRCSLVRSPRRISVLANESMLVRKSSHGDGATALGVKQPRSARRATTSPKPVLVLGRASQPPTPGNRRLPIGPPRALLGPVVLVANLGTGLAMRSRPAFVTPRGPRRATAGG